MSLYIDTKYVGFVGHKLRNFARIDTNLWRFSCPICGDSASNKQRTRGYIFMRDQKLRFQCHNCGDSRTVGKFLEEIDPNIAREYRVEKYKDSNNVTREPKKEKPELDGNAFKSDMSRLKAAPVAKPVSVLDKVMTRLDSLPETHEAVKYCRGRLIPKNQYHKLYVIDEARNICRLAPKYKERIKGTEPRLVFPFYTVDGELGGVSMRGMRGESLRYITVKIKDEDVLIFGKLDVDMTKEVYVVEGQADSLFIPNCIAVGGTAMSKLETLGISKENFTVIFDNQNRNKQVCALIEKSIAKGYRVVIWPARMKGKDINEFIKNGMSVSEVMQVITANTFVGLAAKLRFGQWSRT